MKKRNLLIGLMILCALLVSGCVQMVPAGNYTLFSGETLRGNLLVFSGNATLEEGSRVTGSVLLFSGNLIADGEIGGDIFMFSGNTDLGPQAVVRGDLAAFSGSFSRASGSRVEGQGTLAMKALGAAFILLCVLPILFVVLFVLLIVAIVRATRPRTVERPTPGV